MMLRKPFLTFLLLASVAAAGFGQTATPATKSKTSPSMNPEKKAAGADDKKTGGPFGSLAKDRPKDARTEITCTKEATFDNDSNRAIFTEKVFVKDPQFRLYCDKLVVTLNKERKGIALAEAEGNVVILQEGKNDKGDPVKSTGRSQRAVYEPATGDVTLYGWPQIQQGINNHISTEAGTIMKLNRMGKLTTVGANKTTIVDTSEGELFQ